MPFDQPPRKQSPVPTDRTTAIVLLVGERFFCRFGKGGRAMFAWSLAGATMFGPWRRDEVDAAAQKLRAKGYEPTETTVGVR